MVSMFDVLVFVVVGRRRLRLLRLRLRACRVAGPLWF